MNARSCHRALLQIIAIAVLASEPLGCTRARHTQIGDVEIPKGSTLASDRPVAIEIGATHEAIGAEPGAIKIARKDGHVVYLGAISADQPLKVKLAIPSKDNQLKVRLTARNRQSEASVEIKAGAAQHVFR